MKPLWQRMVHQRFLKLGMILGLASLTFSCNQDARKTKYLESARKYEASEKSAEAIIQYKNALRVDPSFVEARVGLARLLLKLGDTVGCEAELQKVLSKWPDNLDAIVIMGKLYLVTGKLDLAQERSRVALASHPDNLDALVLQGNVLVAMNQADKATEVFRKILDRDSKNIQARTGLSACHILKGDFTEAEKALREAAEDSGQSPSQLLALAVFLDRMNRTPEAVQVLQEAEKRYPANVDLLLPLTGFYLRLGKSEEAKATLAQVRDRAGRNDPRRTLLADYYIAAGQESDALRELQELVRNDGLEGLASQKLGDLLIDQKKLDDADFLVKQLWAKHKNSALGHYLAGRLKLARGDASSALQEFRQASLYGTRVALISYYQGLAYLTENREQEASRAFNRALEENPQFGPPRLERARLELASGDSKSALEDASELIRSWPVPQAWLVYAEALARNGDNTRARQMLEFLIAKSNPGPGRATFRTEAALLDFSRGDFSKGRTILEQVRADTPDSSLAEYWIAASYLMQNEPREAEEVLTVAQNQYPKSYDLLLLLGNVYLAQKKFDIAEAAYGRLLQETPNLAAARLGLAEVAAAKLDWKRAASELEQVGHDQKSSDFLAKGARARERAGQLDEARQDYEEALRLDSTNPVALNNLSWIYLNSGTNIDMALSYAQRAKQLRPNSPEISDTLAWAYYRKRFYQFAVDLLSSAIGAEPKITIYQYHLGKCYLELHDQVGARRAFEAALAASGDFPREDALRELQRLRSSQ